MSVKFIAGVSALMHPEAVDIHNSNGTLNFTGRRIIVPFLDPRNDKPLPTFEKYNEGIASCVHLADNENLLNGTYMRALHSCFAKDIEREYLTEDFVFA